MKYTIAILFIILVLAYPTSGQQIEDVWISIRGNSLVINYNLETDNPEDVFDVQLFSSHDGYKEPLKLVVGDVGPGIKSGELKEVIWNVEDEYGDIELEIKLEIRAVVHSPLVAITNLDLNEKIRRGSVFKLEWDGGDLKQIFSLELISEENNIAHIGNTLNNQYYDWHVPADISLDKTYKIKIVDISDPGNFTLSNSFLVKRKIPWVYRIGAFALAAGITTIIITSTGDNEIPDPPGTPGN